MITPSFGLTATERVLPRLALDWTTGLAQTGVDVTRAGVATFVDANGLIQLASADTQRIDYATSVAGLLVEESRTNTALYSEDLADAYWGKTRVTITTNDIVSPDGNQTADKIVEDTSTDTHLLIRNLGTVTINTPRTASFFISPAERTNVRIQLGSSVSFETVYFNTTTKTFYGAGPNITSTRAITLANGWIWVSVSVNHIQTATGFFVVYLVQGTGTSNTTNYTGDGASGLHVWGIDIQAAAFPTSYIPTEATAVTRNADVATMTGTNFSDWFNASEGTFAVESILTGTNTNRDLLTVSDGTNSNVMTLRWAGGAQAQLSVNAAGAGQVNIAPGGYSTIGTVYNRVFGYKLNDYAQGINGVLVGTDTTALVPTVDRLGITNSSGIVSFTGHVRNIYYWPQKLINAEITAFSKQG
jgi:hypothetical protein